MAAYGQMFCKRDPKPADWFSDAGFLAVLLGRRTVAEAVLNECGGHLAGLANVGAARRLEYLPGIDRATVARVERLWQVAVRLSEGQPP